ncbi:MAG TPA: citrate synthase/methylcitrate synthase [Anaerolineae bacterium]|nr:citrate synthase/methylcitrate synthase [Anaerolineae bacterium]
MSAYIPGLEGVVAARTRLSHVDGQNGILIIGGMPLETLAPNASFEEGVFLLWHDRLPNAAELAAQKERMVAARPLPKTTMELLRGAAAVKAPVIDALRMAVATLSLDDPEPASETSDAQLRRAESIVARFPIIVAVYDRLLKGLPLVDQRPDLGHAGNFLYMLTGKEPDVAATRALATYLLTVIDHGMNASTFTARVITSTRSDLYSAVTGAIGALKGPAHGGAPGPALDMVFEIGTPENAEANIRGRLERGERLMGFGHRVYKVRDPRADVLQEAAKRMNDASGDPQLRDLYLLATGVESTVLRLLDEYKPGRNLKTNVEFFTALVLHAVGLETDLFTPCFAIGRSGGWTAHCLEQLGDNRLIRPSSEYTGIKDRPWVAIEQRG